MAPLPSRGRHWPRQSGNAQCQSTWNELLNARAISLAQHLAASAGTVLSFVWVDPVDAFSRARIGESFLLPESAAHGLSLRAPSNARDPVRTRGQLATIGGSAATGDGAPGAGAVSVDRLASLEGGTQLLLELMRPGARDGETAL
jgi:hypothetical protein